MKYLLTVCWISLLIFPGCSYKFDILIGGKDPFHPLFTLRKPLLVSPMGTRNVPLSDFGVYMKKGEDWDYKNPVWSLVGYSNPLSRIKYGKVPTGFKEGTRRRKLRIGVPYLAMGFSGGGHGSVEFIIIEKEGVYHIRKTDKPRS